MATTQNLFEAFMNNSLPNNKGFIITKSYEGNSGYARFEIISYGNVKEIYKNDEGITFQADGRKLFLLLEPFSYTNKQTEPCYRDDRHKIPYRLKEVEIFTTKRQNRIMTGLKPVVTYTAFTILNPTSLNVSYIVSGDENDEIGQEILQFLYQALWKELKVGRSDSEKAVNIMGKYLPQLLVPFGLE